MGTQKLDELFKEWKDSDKSYKKVFVEDGIVNEKLWNTAKRKVLFVLKDTNGYSGNFRDLVNEKPWIGLGHWSYGLQHTTKSLIPNFSEAVSHSADSCRQAAILNLKKTPGKSTADYEEVKRFAEKDKDYIDKEIEIIKPEVVVMGGVFSICEGLWGEAERMGGRVCRFSRFKDILFIDFPHPKLRGVAPDILYYALMVMYQKFLNGVK